MSWSVHDSVKLESAAIPTATVVTDEFFSLAQSESQNRGMADLPLVKVPHPVGSIALEPIALVGGVDG